MSLYHRLSLIALTLTGCPGDKPEAADDSTGPADADGDSWVGDEDCDDQDAAVYPDAVELCNGKDDDCDGAVDEDDAADAATFYEDQDRDGYGGDGGTTTACEAPDGYAAEGGDCNDDSAAVSPGAQEVCDGTDNDCDGRADIDPVEGTSYYVDADGDRYGAEEVVLCEREPGYVEQGGDCDDEDADVNPGETEVCDDQDNDCDGDVDEDAVDQSSWYLDTDVDGYGDDTTETVACDAPTGTVALGGDCDEDDPAVNPGVEEDCETPDGVDNDCDGNVDVCHANEGLAHWEYGFDPDPSFRLCSLYWDLTWSIRSDSVCPDCIWSADVEFAYDASISDNSGDCIDPTEADWTWTFGLNDDYDGAGSAMLYYYYAAYEYAFPVWPATWDSSSGYLTWYSGYVEYPYRYGGAMYYYTRLWSGYSWVDPS